MVSKFLARLIVIFLVLVPGLLLGGPAALAQSDELMEAFGQGQALEQAGRYGDAVPFYTRALELGEHEFGPNHQITSRLLNNLAGLYWKQGRFSKAVPLFKRAISLDEKELGPNHPDIAIGLNNLAVVYKDQGRYSDAKLLYERALAIRRNAFGADHPDIANSLNNLAVLYQDQGLFGQAEPLYLRALEIREKSFGPNHPKVALTLNTLAELYRMQGRYGRAEPLYVRALSIREETLGPDHPSVAISLNNLAELYREQGRYGDAEPLYKRSLAIKEEALGSNHPSVATGLNNLAVLYSAQGKYDEAEPLARRALTIMEETYGADHPNVAQGLSNLASLYDSQGRYDKSGPLHKRALEIFEKSQGADHPAVAIILNNLAVWFDRQDQLDEAEPLYKRSLAILEDAFGESHPSVATGLNNLAEWYRVQGRFEDAAPLYKRSLTIREKTLGAGHPDVAQSLNNLALLYQDLGRYRDAEALYQRSLSILENAFGPEHPTVARSIANLAGLYGAQYRASDALDTIRRATAIYRKRAARMNLQRSGGGLSEQKSVSDVFVGHVLYAWSAAQNEPSRRAALTAEAFEAGQLARATATAAAVAGMGARFAAGDDALAGLVRAQQDATEQWQRTDKALIDAVGRLPDDRDSQAEDSLRRQLADMDRKLTELEAQLTRRFPDYAELAAPKPIPLAEVQALLGPDEALMSYVAANESTYLWVVRRDRAEMAKLDIGAEELNRAVLELRAGLDPTVLRIRRVEDIPSFDTTLAYELYTKLFAPAEPLLEGVRHLFVVPDAGLQSLPLGVLITAKPLAPADGFEGYRTTPWLARKYAMSVLPSVSSLRALRTFAKTARANQPFLGIGDPVLEGGGYPEGTRGVQLASLFTSRGIADVSAVRSQLAPLPETADELAAMARALGAGADSLMLRQGATERAVRAADLTPYKVLAFATHGLVAGDLVGLTEPALVLTPPETGSAEDDGLLTASEVALLKLDADWVILSACNTASSDGTPGAEGLSGLAKAFFYAGSRSLLVSHWPVASDATVRLTTDMLTQTSRDPGLRRAEALQRAMLSMIADTDTPAYYAHPMFWAPFMLVGEGAGGAE